MANTIHVARYFSCSRLGNLLFLVYKNQTSLFHQVTHSTLPTVVMAVFTAINHFNEEPSIPTPDSTMTPESMEEVSSASTTQVKKEIDQKVITCISRFQSVLLNTQNANPTLPSTPQKRGTDQDPMNDDDNEPSAESPNKEAKSKSPSKKSGVLGPIPSSYEEASAEDKMIIQMKEVEGKAWADIKKALEEITGAKMGGGIHVRYARMKANFVVFDKGDVCFYSSSSPF